MTARQSIATASAPLVALTMVPVFRIAGAELGAERGWYAGFLTYWLVWCLLFPAATIGARQVLESFRHGTMTPVAWLTVALPPAVALASRWITPGGAGVVAPGMAMAVVNGTLEEICWRGVFTRLFPSSVWWGVLWPAGWFGVWHFAPGALSMGERAWTLAAASAGLGVALGWVAQRSRSIRWTVLSHVLAGVLIA